MRWFKIDLWKLVISITGLLLILVFMVWVPVTSVDARERILGPTPTATIQTTPIVDPTLTALQKRKLIEDIQQEQEAPVNTVITSMVPLFTAIDGSFIAYSTYFFNARKERHDREEALEKRAEELFKSVVENLGNESDATKVGAAIQLRSFLSPDYARFHKQVFALAVANLRLRKTDPNKPEPLDPLNQELVVVFRESFLLVRNTLSEQDYRLLDHIQLDNAYLAQADLKGIQMRKASLRDVDLKGTDLSNADLSGADLSGTNIEAALTLNKTDLHDAKGLKDDLLKTYEGMGAIIDKAIPDSSTQQPVSPVPPSQ